MGGRGGTCGGHICSGHGWLRKDAELLSRKGQSQCGQKSAMFRNGALALEGLQHATADGDKRVKVKKNFNAHVCLLIAFFTAYVSPGSVLLCTLSYIFPDGTFLPCVFVKNVSTRFYYVNKSHFGAINRRKKF